MVQPAPEKAPEAEVGLHRISASMETVVVGQENVITERCRSTRRLASYRGFDGEQLESFTERHTQSYSCVKKITLPIDWRVDKAGGKMVWF